MPQLFPTLPEEAGSQIKSAAGFPVNFVVKSMLGPWVELSRSERQKCQDVQKSRLMIVSLSIDLFYNTLN